MFIVDDIIIGASLAAVAQGLGSRLASKYIKTPFETAQLASVDIQRERLSQDARLFRERMDAEWSRHQDAFRQRLELLDVEHSLRKWPLDNLPAEIKSEREAYKDSAINLFICSSSEHFFQPIPESGSNFETKISRQKASDLLLTRQVLSDVKSLNHWVTNHFNKVNSSHPVIPYIASQTHVNSHSTPQALATSLRYHLHTEPCVFVHVESHSLRSATVYTEIWGLLSDGLSEGRSPALASNSFQIRTHQSRDELNQIASVDLALKVIVSSILDLSHLVYSLSRGETKPPLAPQILSKEPEFAQVADGVFNFYSAILRETSKVVPALAIEEAMSFVDLLLQVERPDLAQSCFTLGRDQAAQILGCSTTEREWHETAFLGHPGNEHFRQLLGHIRRTRQKFQNLDDEEVEVEDPILDHYGPNTRKLINKLGISGKSGGAL